MLVSLAILIILVTMWHGFGSRSNQERQKLACQKNLRTIYMALEIFANEHEDRFPSVPGAKTSEEPLGLLVPKYTVASDVFVCPGSKDGRIASATPLEGERISYAYFMNRRRTDPADSLLMSDRWINLAPKPKGAPVFSSNGKAPGNNHHQYGGNFLQVDGEVRTSGPKVAQPIEWSGEVVLLNPK